MINSVRNLTKKILAGSLLLTAETVLSLGFFVLALSVFVLVAKYVFWDKKEEFDQKAFLFFDAFINERNNSIVVFITQLGNYQFLVVANVLVILYFLLIRKHKWYSIKIPAVAVGSVSIMFLLKMWFSRPRPLFPLLAPALGFSFPSGHAMSSMTFFGLLIYFTWKKVEWSRALRAGLIGFLVLLILAIGISRVYLRVHYASDVLGGYCAGIIWLIVSIRSIDVLERVSKARIERLDSEGL